MNDRILEVRHKEALGYESEPLKGATGAAIAAAYCYVARAISRSVSEQAGSGWREYQYPKTVQDSLIAHSCWRTTLGL